MSLTEPAEGRQPGRGLRAFAMRRRTQVVLDLVVLSAAFGLAYLLRFEFQVPAANQRHAFTQLPLVLLLQMTALFLSGIHNFVWRYIGLREVGAFARAALISAGPMLLLRFGLPAGAQSWRVPLSIIILDTIFAFGGLLALRVLRRMLYERYARHETGRNGDGTARPVLLIGAGRAGVLAVREIASRGDMGMRAVGFVDDDPLKQGMVIHGAKVLGTTRDLPRLARELGVGHVLLTIAEADPLHIRRILELCARHRLEVRSVPGLYEVLQGKVAFSRFRTVGVEELLGRPPVRLDETRLERFLSGRRVMVTGAGGSIGSELARQIARFGPARLLLFERAEGALFEVHHELARLWPGLELVPLVGDVGDEGRVREVLAAERPEIVFHAAAHKHVPLMETNAGEAVKNNVLGTWRLGRLAGEAGVEALVLISTDKAVRPTSVMGATKRVAELVVQHLDALYPRTRYLAVRFGNVMGSAGSVIEIFRRQIADGGPVTVTDPEMTRYFMTIPEASLLVLQAGAMGEGGEIFVLDMGEPVKIDDLARKMIELSGYEPGRDIEIVYTGPRPGEKLFEELELAGEQIAKTRHPKIFIGRLHPYPAGTVERALDRLGVLAEAGDDEALRLYLGELLPEARLEDGAGAVGEARRVAVAAAE
jgi:FlaA1/EpsC-like NDP-sugar epimerase